MPPGQKIVVICGPTATGKTALALALAAELQGEIVNADSTQVYRGLDLGTAKPSPEERAKVPHHLFDVAEPDRPLSAADWARAADRAIEEIAGRGHLPLLVGGTGFYLRALIDGLFEAPPLEGEIRRALEKRAQEEGIEALHGELARVDPETAAALAPRDRFRILRALEVFEASGTPISVFRKRHAAAGGGPRYRALWIGLNLPRPILYARIDERQAEQVRRGLPEEYRLLAARYGRENRLLNGLCYRHMRLVEEGRATLEEALRLDQRDNRRYAKRQITWFKKVPGIRWYDPRNDQEAIRRAVREFLLL